MSGELLVDGVSVATETTSELSRKVGYVFQNPENQLFALTVEKDVAFGPENLGLTREEIRGRVEWAMCAAGTDALHATPPTPPEARQTLTYSLSHHTYIRPRSHNITT